MDLIQSTHLLIKQITNQCITLNDNYYNILEEIKQKDIIINNLNKDIIIKDNIILEKIQELENFSKVSVLISTNKELANRNNYIKILEEQLAKLKNIKNPDIEIKNPDIEIKNPDIEIKNPDIEIKNPDIEIKNPDIKIKNPDIEIKNPDIKIKNPDIKIKNPDIKIKNPDIEIKNPDIKIKNPDIEIKKKNKLLDFNIDKYEDIEDYELISYKKNYYLKNNLNEIYSIKKYKPYKLIGMIDSKGKIVLNDN